jgi:hypothetical protein
LLRDFRSLRGHNSLSFKEPNLSVLVQEVLTAEMVLFSNSGVRVESYLNGLPQIMVDCDQMKQVVFESV